MKVKKIWFQQSLLVPHLQPSADQAFQQRLHTVKQELLGLLTQHRFVNFVKHPNLYYDNQLHCLWLPYGFKAAPEEMFNYVEKLQIYAFRQWEIPELDEVRSLAQVELPGLFARLQNATVLSGTLAEIEAGGYQTIHLGTNQVGRSKTTETIIPLHRSAYRDILSFIVGFSMLPKGVAGVEERLQDLYTLTMEVNKARGSEPPPPSLRALEQHFLELDYLRARLPVLEPAYLYDMEKGLWELHQPTPPTEPGWVEIALEEPWEARNPERDVRHGVVAIDFGTSSTVVACREDGKTTLLRVGMGDFFQKPTPEDYQNPTVLALINLPNLMTAWNSIAYQPLTRWDDLHFSHEALRQFRENAADQKIVAGMLTGIKQWPLNASRDLPLRITDQETGSELEIYPGQAVMPVKGQPLMVSAEDPFDPIELYAYYLGLFINHRSSGLFLEYYLTFPITYPRQVKQTILASFSRGLQRSLPVSLLNSRKMEEFSVREEGSEPAAYAACALGELGIEASSEGTAYAVFDFGGGSTDFDFGLYRTPSLAEEEQGYEKVIEHFWASGDMYLGGENLIANLVYQTFRHNLDICREHRISFVCPPEGERFPGHELFIDHSHVAQTNSALLMAKLRPLWEDFQWVMKKEEGSSSTPPEEKGGRRGRRLSDVLGDSLYNAIASGDFKVNPDSRSCRLQEKKIHKIHLELLNRDRNKVTVEFKLDRNRLNYYLIQRVGKGLLRFFIAMKQAFDSRNRHPKEVHILLAGNASRSLLVQGLFAAVLQERMVGWEGPEERLEGNPAIEALRADIPFPRFVVHRPPTGDPEDPYRPTAKTGVAIGLLKLIPGETLLAISPMAELSKGEAPFRFYVGSLRRGRFHPVLPQNGPYHQWSELGIPTRGAFVLIYSNSPMAALGTLQRGALELKEKALRFPRGLEGKKLFAQAIGPATLEIAMADTLDQVTKNPESLPFLDTVELV